MPPHYDTFVMRQEIEAAFGLWPDRSAGFYEVRDGMANKKLKSETVFQDPYRKVNFATTRPLMEDLADRITAAIADGIEASDIMIFTLGLTECWRHRETGKYMLQSPFAGYGTDLTRAEFHQTTFADNYANVRSMLDAIFARYPDKKIIISVSPVRLKMTFSKTDVATANVESKAILRAVAGQICREYGEKVLYFPSYEMAMMALGTLTGYGNVFTENGMVVRDDFVSMVMRTFMQVITPPSVTQPTSEVA